MVVGGGNLYDEAEIGFDHELTGLIFSSANPSGDLSFIFLIQEGSLSDSLQVGLKGGGEFGGAKGGFSSLSFLSCCLHTRFDRWRKRTFGLFFGGGENTEWVARI